MRTCFCCKESKEDINFHKDKTRFSGFAYRCKKCSSIIRKKHYSNNKESTNKHNNEWYANNSEKKYLKGAEWKKNNPEANREIHNRWNNKRLKEDPIWFLQDRIRKAIRRVLILKQIPKDKKTLEILGCSFEYFHNYMGKYKQGYELDHICPVSQARTEEELYKLNYYTNFQWLTREESQAKLNKPIQEAIQKCKELLGREWIYD